jgi:hypothetical protein
VACAVAPSVTTSSTNFSFQTCFFGIYLNFQRQKSLKNQYLPHSESKSYQIQLQFNLIFSEEIIQYSRTFVPQFQTSWNQAHTPLLVESFPKTSSTPSEASWFGGSHNYKTKQTAFLHI